MKVKGQVQSSSQGKGPHHNNNNHNNNNNSHLSSSGNMKEAERQLSVILKTAKNMCVTSDDLGRLRSVKKLTQGRMEKGESWRKHSLPLLVALLSLLIVCFLVCSIEDRGYGCLQNSSETLKTVPVSQTAIPTTPVSEEVSGDDQSEQWRTDSLRKER